jgi:hypothetical protein
MPPPSGTTFEIDREMQNSVTLLLSLFFLASPAIGGQHCQTELRTPEIEVLGCVNDFGLRTVLLSLRPANFPPLVAGATFNLWLSPLLPQRLLGTSERKILTNADQEILRRALLNPLSDSSRAVLRFLADFVEPGFTLNDFDLSGRSLLTRVDYTSICHRFGKVQLATFRIGRKLHRKQMVVGSGACIGQCGVDCQDPDNPRQGRYTQECLNHDACSYETGENLGSCENEFWAAADGFFAAPVCN